MTISKKYSQFAGLVFSVSLLGIAFWIIHSKLKTYQYHQIASAMQSIPLKQLFSALVITFFSYFIMTFYDYLALRYIQVKLPFSKIAHSSFISYSFSNNMGHPLITGAVRYRLYSAWGLNTIDIAKVVAFCTFTLWLGFLFLAGLFFTFAPVHLPDGYRLPFGAEHILGSIFLAVVLSYFIVVSMGKIRIPLGKWSFVLPQRSLAISQLIISSIDWVLASSVLYILLPQGHNIHYLTFLGFYLMAQMVAVVSQVPGGIGIFESLMLVLLGGAFSPAVILGILLANRVIYYLIPLGFGALLFAVNEIMRQRQHIMNTFKLYDKFFGPWAPQVYAVLVFLGGIVLLFSTATPSLHHRLLALQEIVPVPVIEISHFLGSIIGIALLFVARGLQKRLDSAYYLTVLMLLAGILISLLKGFDFEEALILSGMLMLFIPSHRNFYRKTSILNQPLNPIWLISIGIAVVATAWLGFFSYKHVDYSSQMWWTFSLYGDAPRFLRALVGLGVMLFIISIIRLFKVGSPTLESAPDMDAVERIIKTSDRTSANLALVGDKRFLVNPAKTAFIMYAVEGKSWVAMGDPVGKEEDYEELIWQFRELCDQHGGRTVFYEIGTKNLSMYLDIGLTLIKIGEDAKVDLETFSMDAPGHKRHRRTLKTVEADGCSFDIVTSDEVTNILLRLKIVSDTWLESKNAKEKSFSLGYFSEAYIARFPVGIVTKNSEIIAFANLWATDTHQEISIDLMRYIPEKADNVMEFLLLKLILWAKENHYKWFDLGIAPFSGLFNRSLAPLWHRLGSLIFKYGVPAYSLQGLRQYKEKFDPVWEAIYIASPGGLVLPEVLLSLQALISRGHSRKDQIKRLLNDNENSIFATDHENRPSSQA